MPAHRFFLDTPLTGAVETLEGEEFHHLKNVMRARTGHTIEIVNGKGVLARGRVVEIKRESAAIEITQRKSEPPPAMQLILAQALIRPVLLDWVIEKGTELGVAQFWLFPGDLSEKKELTYNQHKRLQTLIASALKQCGRLYLPTLEVRPPLSQWDRPEETILFGSLAPEAVPLRSTYRSPIIMVIGPEKGLSPEESTVLEKNLHAKPVSLHRNILRAETAAICALSLLSQQLKY